MEIKRQLSCPDKFQPKNVVIWKQLETMKDQTLYMKQFRVALGSALDEVKSLRSELAQEKSKEFEVLRDPRQSTLCTKEKSLDTRLPSPKDVSSIIAESEDRLNRIKDAISEKKDLVQDLRKKLQFSSNVLFRRENKLEEKINRESQMKSEIQALTSEINNLQISLKEKIYLLDKEKELVRLKDIKIRDLTDRLTDMEMQLNSLYNKMSERNKELSDARNCWRSYPPCPDCSWMRNYIFKLEYQLERHRYTNYDYSMPNGSCKESYDKQWPARSSHFSFVNSPPQSHHRLYKQSRNEAHKRHQVNNRQRSQDFRSASQILSPIREDTEESNNFTISNNIFDNGKTTTQHSAPTFDSLQTKQTRKQTSNYISSEGSCNYLTVRSGSHQSDRCSDGSNDTSTTYLQIASCKHDDDDKLLHHDAIVFPGSTSTPIKRDTSGETSDSHQLSAPTDNHRTTGTPPIRSFPFLNSSLTSCDSVASTETSDATACSSDSGLVSKHKKRLKTKRSKRKQRSNVITFRGHDIDVTQFTTPDFRQIMWLLGGDSKAVDEFLAFLSNHARRLQSDSHWADKHSLGSPEAWSALIGSY